MPPEERLKNPLPVLLKPPAAVTAPPMVTLPAPLLKVTVLPVTAAEVVMPLPVMPTLTEPLTVEPMVTRPPPVREITVPTIGAVELPTAKVVPAPGGGVVEALYGGFPGPLNTLFEAEDNARDIDSLIYEGLTTIQGDQSVVPLTRATARWASRRSTTPLRPASSVRPRTAASPRAGDYASLEREFDAAVDTRRGAAERGDREAFLTSDNALKDIRRRAVKPWNE